MSSAIFVGCARDCGPYLSAVLKNIDRIALLYSKTAFIFVENNSTDGTNQCLREWVNNRENAFLLEMDGPLARMQSRTDRIASARNAYLHYIRESQFNTYDHLIVFDFHQANIGVIDLNGFQEAIQFLVKTPDAAGVLPVSDPVYYDIWALRHPEWSPDDCWHNVRKQQITLGLQEATKQFVYSRQRLIAKEEEPIQVTSAFGGLGIYKLSDALTSEYIGKSPQGEEVCEHVIFSEKITSQSGRSFYIFPRLRNWAPPEHQQPMEVAVRKIRLEQDGSQCEIWAPQEHPLDAYRQSHPLYDRRLPLLAQLVQKENNQGFIIDIGANIGDTIALLRLAGVQSPIVALEPSPKFYAVLKINIAAHSKLFSQVQALHAFAGDPTHTLRLDGGVGTASSRQVQSKSSFDQPASAPTIPLDYLGIQDISIIKIDTDGYDASILQSELSYLARTLPVVWVEADIKSSQQHVQWIDLLGKMANIFEWVCVFDNFGFLITHGPLRSQQSTIINLLRYTYRHTSMPVKQFGQPRIYYIDMVFFPLCRHRAYSDFIQNLPEAKDS